MSMSTVLKYYNSPNSLSRSPDMSTPRTRTITREACYILPFAKNRDFVGRKDELEILIEKLLTNHDCMMAILGAGGMGKTQLALQFTYMVKEQRPAVSIFWMPASSMESFERACADIVVALHINRAGANDAKMVLKEYFSSGAVEQWLIVLDNVDDYTIFDYMPQSKKGMTVITTRHSDIAAKVVSQGNLLKLQSMSHEEAAELFHKTLINKELAENYEVILLTSKLACWPLAIVLAAAYLNTSKVSIEMYLVGLKHMESYHIRDEVEHCINCTRLEKRNSRIAAPLMISFTHLRNSNAQAADLLSFISCTEWRAIPHSLLLSTQSEGWAEAAINTLCSYSLLTKREGDVQAETSNEEWYDMHPVVHSAARVWTGKFETVAADTKRQALKHITDVIASNCHTNQVAWRVYRPHALRMLKTMEGFSDETKSLLTGQCLLFDEKTIKAVNQLKESCRWSQSAREETDADRLLREYTLAIAYRDIGLVKQAMKLLEHVVGVQEKALAEHHPRLLPSQHALASTYALDGQIKKAVMLFEHVVAVQEKVLAKGHPRQLVSQRALARACELDRQSVSRATTSALMSFFGELMKLRSLHDKLFERSGRESVIVYYHGVLKSYALRLEGQSKTRTHFEELTIRVLKCIQSRNTMVHKIFELLNSDHERLRRRFDLLINQLIMKELARWVEGLPAADVQYFERGQAHAEGTCEGEDGFGGIDNHSDRDEDSDEGCDCIEKPERPDDSQDHFDTNFPYLIDGTKELTHRHTDVLNLELRLLLLPASLREVVKTVPREDIRVSYTDDVTIINRIKALVEDNTAIEWDWWPLKSRVPDLPPYRQRLEWQISGYFFYQAVSSIEAAEVQSVLDQIGSHPPKCYCCRAKANQQNTSEFLKDVSTRLIEKIQNYWPISSSASAARLRYTPSNTPAAGTSSASANNAVGATSSQSSNVTSNFAQVQSNSTNVLPTNPSQASAWVIFGIEDGSGFNDIENIDTSCPLMNDATFFTELRRLESKYRWSLLRRLSPYIFCYCRFVQFDTMNIDRVYCCGEHLPEDHHREAQYHPRPRIAERPPIGKHEFMRYLRTCSRYCLWSRLPFFRHRCCRPYEASHKWQRIPRKLSLFDTKVALPENVAYGLEAVYVLSFPVVFVYHTASILAWFGFWVWWLKLHPSDLQNASVPMMVFLGIVASFWVLPGRQKDV